MFISADQLLAHAIGDYILQSDWMATTKTKKSVACFVHVVTYSVPFIFFKPSLVALGFIMVTHFLIDRWRLARFVVTFKNIMGDASFGMAPISHAWKVFGTSTGYAIDTPPWLAFWLLIIVDNIMHVALNGFALRYL